MSFKFYFNKYALKPFKKKRYFMSYIPNQKVLWYRVYKVGTRTIDELLRNEGGSNYRYGSAVPYLPNWYKEHFKFGFVRNPIERFISAWKDKVVRSNYFNFSESDHDKMKNISNFIDWVGKQDVSNCDEHLMEQSALIDLENVDFIGRFEHFEDDLRIVCDKLGYKQPQFAHKNSTSEVKTPIELTDEDLAKLKSIYANDIKNFYPNLH